VLKVISKIKFICNKFLKANMRDSYLTKGIDGVTVLLGTALILNGVIEFAVLSENFDQFGG
jgi:hypothetical protein